MGSSKEGKIRSAPAYTITGREKPPLIPVMIFPGPGYYDGEYTVVKPKPPVYSMRGKYKMGSEDSKPGPGAHCPEKVSLGEPKTNFICTFKTKSYLILCFYLESLITI